MAFLYFTDSRTKPEQLDQLFEKRPASREVLSAGPSGKAGNIWFGSAFDGRENLAGYYPDKQRWIEAYGRGYWVGTSLNEQHKAEQFARTKQIAGHKVDLGETGLWTIPLARAYTLFTQDLIQFRYALPRKTEFIEGHWRETDVIEKCERLHDIGLVVADLADGKTDFEEEDFVHVSSRWCVEILATNYLVSDEECSMLGILSETNRYDILKALIDYPTIAAQKKMTAPIPAGE